MADEYEHTGLEIVGRRLPDHSFDTDSDGIKHKVELPGKYQVGVLIEGAFHPLAQWGYASVQKRIANAKRNQQPSAAAEQ
jgi:hypothetical protein